MRAFRISLVLFALMAALIVGSMVMNRYVSGRMRDMTEALPESPDEEAAAALEDFWEQWRAWMRPTMNQVVWREVDGQVAVLAAYARLGDEGKPEYVGAGRQLLCAIEEMSRPERAALQNLF